MKVAKVKAGICGFYSEISASSQNGRQVDIIFKTECPNLQPMEKELRMMGNNYRNKQVCQRLETLKHEIS
ncbi:hypothetical protein JCM15765_42580 [Paradesulfitobacterium aromaticivorans]